LYDFFVEKAHATFPDRTEDAELLCQMSEMWGAYIGDPIWKQSLRFSWMEECCGGGKNSLPIKIKSYLLIVL
jgi:hypothetical protein